MARQPEFSGIIVPLVTPMFESGEIDLVGIQRLAAHLLAADSVNGIFALGATGEYMKLTTPERREITRALGKAERHGKAVVVNVGGVEKEEMLALASAAADAGLTGVAAVVPESVPNKPAALYEHFAPLGDTGLPVIIYWTPHVKSHKPSPEALEALMRIPGFAGIKDSSRDMEVFAAICAQFGDTISIFQGVEMLHLPSLVCGSAGVIGGGLNLYPSLLAGVSEAFDRHAPPRARDLQQQAARNWARLNRHGSFRWITKRYWAEQGLIEGTWCRVSDDVPLTEPEMEEIRAMVKL